ncbi:MAG: DUF4065 domain-containing protein [Clostridia bacterium]|nr:DUF4065 domain-containing protein [Clostridia bacterium]
MEKLSIFDVANFFLKIVDRDSGSTITPLKLQKILYYAQGYFLAYYNQELFSEDFQAWAHGPANEQIYEKYKKFGFESIPYPNESIPYISNDISDFLTDIWETFGIYDGKYLEEQTHKEDPWIIARNGIAPGERCTNIIEKENMKKFFKKVINVA